MKRFLAVFLTAAVLILGTACSGDAGNYSGAAAPAADSATYETYDSYGEYDDGYNDYADEAAYMYSDDVDYKYGDRASDTDEGAALPTFLTPDNEQGIKLVYTVDMTLQTTEFAEGTRCLLQSVEVAGGYVRSTYVMGRSLYTPDGPRYARYTLSIPTEELSGFLVELEDRYNLVHLNQESREITKKYSGQSGELATLREREETLQTRIAALDPDNEDDRSTLRELEWELQNVQRQINSLTTSVAGMDNDILYSTVTVQLYEVVDLEDFLQDEDATFGERFLAAAQKSWNGFVAFWQGALLVLLYVLPVLAVLAVAALIVLLVRRALRRSGLASRMGLRSARKTINDTAPQMPRQPGDQDNSRNTEED